MKLKIPTIIQKEDEAPEEGNMVAKILFLEEEEVAKEER